MKKLPAILTIVSLTLALTACSGSGSKDTDSAKDAAAAITDSCTGPGKSSKAVTVSGDYGTQPDVKFKKPLTAQTTERSVAIKGSGTEKAGAGSLTELTYSVFNASTGKELGSTGYGDAAKPENVSVNDSGFPGLIRALNCSRTGDRVVAVIPPKDAFGKNGNPDAGIGPKDSLLFVIDVAVVTRATGADQAPEAGLPPVELAKDGAPKITIPQAEPPADLKVSTLKKGSGTVVAAGDTVAVEYTGVIWKSGKEFDSSWKTTGPASFATDKVVPGFGSALVGQTVGSQVLAVIPPAQGYGPAGNDQAGITGKDTLVFVVDILATAATPAAAPK